MNEIQRQAYLEAMGIQSYFPRLVLPGAPLPRQCQWPQEVVDPAWREAPLPAAEPAPARATPPEVPESPSLAQARPGPARPSAAPAQREAPPPAAREPGPQAEAPGEEVRFTLAVMQAGSGLCILNELPAAGSPVLSGRHRALLRNLLAALPGARPEPRYDDMPFRWPFLDSPHVDKSAGAARAALNAFLEQKSIAAGPLRVVLVMGRRIAPFVAAPGDDAPERGGPLEPAGRPWRLLVTRSLDEMLRLPALKRDVWRDLRALGRLHDADT